MKIHRKRRPNGARCIPALSIIAASCWFPFLHRFPPFPRAVVGLSGPARRRGGASTTTTIVSRKSEGGYSRTFSLDDDSDDDSNEQRRPSSQRRRSDRLRRRASALPRKFRSALRSTFLPAGYPAHTPPGYLPYCIWDCVQDFSTQLRAVLATRRVLEGVGVGREGATALSATLNFLVRDASGMAASLLFTSVAASKFRSDVKRWKFFADMAVDVGIALEVLAPAAPPHLFLPLICAGNVCKAVCGVAAGSCGSAINLHWSGGAGGSDISDVSAKFGAQRTAAGGLGILLAAAFARSTSSASSALLVGLFSALTALHLYANVRALRLAAFDSMNTHRLHRAATDFLDAYGGGGGGGRQSATKDGFPDPVDVSRTEPLFFLPAFQRREEYSIRMGVSFNDFARISLKTNAALKELVLRNDGDDWKSRHILSVGNQRTSRGRDGRERGRCILIAFFPGASRRDTARAYLHGLVLTRALEEVKIEREREVGGGASSSCADAEGEGRHSDSEDRISYAEVEATLKMSDLWPVFERVAAAAGWNLDATECSTEGYELFVE